MRVKQHTRKTKKGKMTLVREYQREFHSIKTGLMKEALKHARQLKSKHGTVIPKEHRDKFNTQSKLQAIKFVAKKYGLTKHDPELRQKADEYYGRIKSITDKIFDNPKLGITWREAQGNTWSHPNTKSKYNFGFFSNGEVLDKQRKTPVELGYTYYNQNIVGDETWGKTMARKNLQFIQLQRPKVGVEGFRVVQYKIVNDKVIGRELGNFAKEQVVQILKDVNKHKVLPKVGSKKEMKKKK